MHLRRGVGGHRASAFAGRPGGRSGSRGRGRPGLEVYLDGSVAGQNGPVLIPGDPERRTHAERMANGVPVDDETWRELTAAARAINVLVEPPGPKSA